MAIENLILNGVTHDITEEIKSALNDIGTTGINIFDKRKAKSGVRITPTGTETDASSYYCSDFIPVLPSTQYSMAVGLGSSTHLNVAYYDNTKTFISGETHNTVNAWSFTTPATCYYIRINGALTKIDDQLVMVKMSGLNYTSEYQLIIDGKNESGVYLVSTSEICYDKTTGYLKSAENIFLVTPDNRFTLGTSVNVGTSGGYLYWDKESGSVFASASTIKNSETYMLALLSASKKYNGKIDFCAIDSVFPIFTVDLVNDTLKVDIKGQPCYVIYNGVYYTVAKNYTQTLTLPNHGFVYFDPTDCTFGVSSSLSAYDLARGIPVLIRYYRGIYSIAPYKTAINDTAYKNFVCYGDSLTWYDGNNFTWGIHQGEECVGFESYLLNELNSRTVYNRGQSGKTTPEICAHIEEATDLASMDVMIIMGGNNDDRLDVAVGTVQPVGSTFDTSTVCGALQSAIEFALDANPSLRIILMTEPMGWTYRTNTMVRVSDAIPQAYRDVAEFYGLPLIDLWNKSGINEFTRATYYADPTDNHLYMYHPNNEGWIQISKIICSELKAII